MKNKYNTVAVCNALVDIEIRLTEKEFKTLRFPRASMTLVDVEESQALLRKFKNKEKNYSSGGSVGNTIYALAKLGSRAGVIVNVGKDEFGKKYKQDYRKVGVDFLGQEREGSTGVCLVFITPDTARTLVTTLGCASEFTEDILEQVYTTSTDTIYLESYLLTNENNIKLLSRMTDKLKKAGRKVILSDSDWFCVNMFPKVYPWMFKRVDVFFSNADQFRAMCGYQHEEDMEVGKYFRRYHSRKTRPDLLVVTNSHHGAYLSRTGSKSAHFIHYPARKVKVVDSNGAGDGFAAGVMHEYFKGSDLITMGERGTEVASRIISRFGARYR